MKQKAAQVICYKDNVYTLNKPLDDIAQVRHPSTIYIYVRLHENERNLPYVLNNFLPNIPYISLKKHNKQLEERMLSRLCVQHGLRL